MKCHYYCLLASVYVFYQSDPAAADKEPVTPPAILRKANSHDQPGIITSKNKFRNITIPVLFADFYWGLSCIINMACKMFVSNNSLIDINDGGRQNLKPSLIIYLLLSFLWKFLCLKLCKILSEMTSLNDMSYGRGQDMIKQHEIVDDKLVEADWRIYASVD